MVIQWSERSWWASPPAQGRFVKSAAEYVKISMDGRGRALDNIFVERFWRSVKYEDIYLHDYPTVPEVVAGLRKYFLFYNTERQHQSLDYKTPQEVYEGQKTGGIRTLCAA